MNCSTSADRPFKGAIAGADRGERSRRRGRTRDRRRDPRRRTLQGQYRRQYARRAARRAHPVPHRQYRRGASGGRPRLHHARHRLRLHGHLSPHQRSRQGEDRLRRAHHARRGPRCRDPGEGRVHRHAGAVHSQDRGDQGRARQADVPDPGEDRSRAIARARRAGAEAACPASPTSSSIRRSTGRPSCRGPSRSDRAQNLGRADRGPRRNDMAA